MTRSPFNTDATTSSFKAATRTNTGHASTDTSPVVLRTWMERWPEYSIEAVLVGLFMISACVFTVLFWLPSSPVPVNIPSIFVRRLMTGTAMGLTAIVLIYSPWGQRSGAHMNPSVTLAFYRLHKLRSAEAALYILFQFLGGMTGVWIAARMLGSRLGQPAVQYAATYPGKMGTALAAAAEFVISFLLMFMVLHISNHARLSRFTGIFAGLLIATYITFESPYSGMSMNPARTFASALPSGIWTGFWIYLVVPPIAMLSAAEFYTRTGFGQQVMCCKMFHNPRKDCTFCGRKRDDQ